MKQLTLDFALPPESVITLAIPFTADLKRELVTHMVTAIIAVYQAGGALTDEHASAASQNHPPHLQRKAMVYLRQSSDRQVQRHTESQRLQYDLAERARALGLEQVEIIDTDLGHSAAVGAGRRAGFERLIAAVAVGEVGLVLCLEASRLSRTDHDWCRLLELCPLFDTLIADADTSTMSVRSMTNWCWASRRR